MGLHLHISNSLSKLSDKLTQQLKNSHSNIFIPDTIVAQTEGMHIWLKEQIAQKNGIASNIQFIQPNDVILLAYKLLGGSFEKAISRDNLIWILFQLLNEPQFAQLFPEQAKYIGKGLPDEHFKRIGLATKVADLFDQYQIYRQEFIKEWNEPLEGKKVTDWQEYLWRKVKETAGNKVPDKTEIAKFIESKLQESDPNLIQKLQTNLRSVYLFGLSIITSFHIEILDKLSKVIDIHYFLINPSPEFYWIEDQNEKTVAKRKLKEKILDQEDYELIGNDLLTSWGKVTSTTLKLLYKQNSELFDISEEDIVQHKADTLLGAIQQDIFNNEIDYLHPYPKTYLQDQTLTVHGHYTIAREVEGLYQYLLHIIQNSPEKIQSRDIAIFATDIDAYAPYIQAIFENGPIKLRFKIADTEITNGDSIFSVLQKILELNTANFTSENVLQIIESKYVQSIFGLTDIDKIRSVVKFANIRFGVQGEEEDETYLVSWVYGLKRIMYGICMSGEPMYKDSSNENLFPIDLIEGFDSQNIISFVYFVELLIQNLQLRKKPRNLITWNQYILTTVNDFIYLPGEDLEEDYQMLEKRIKDLNEDADIYKEEIDFEIFSFNFIETLQRTKRNALFLKDGITFCSLIPMRSIPFKVIGMLGMDSDHFPRKEDKLSFNKLASGYKLGDRDVKENDKNLFLETLMSAQNYLYISYIGKSIKDNKDINPSVLVDELLTYIDKRALQDSDDNAKLKGRNLLFYTHPLYTNSKKYNQWREDEVFLYKYQIPNSSQNVILKNVSSDELVKEEMNKEIQLHEFISFFQDAPKRYYNKVFGIYYNDDMDVLPEEEIFNLDKLQTIQVENAILENEAQLTDNTLVTELKLKGKLPLKNPGVLSFQNIEISLEALIERWKSLTKNNIESKFEFSFKLLNYNIKCNLSKIFNEELIIISYKEKTEDDKNLIYAYILNLISIYNELNININLIGKNIFLKAKKDFISKEKAKLKLENLIRLFEKGGEQLLPFSGTLILEEKEYKDLVNLKNEKNQIRKIANDSYKYPSAYLKMAFKDGLENSPTLHEDWIEFHQQLIFPMREAFESFIEEDK